MNAPTKSPLAEQLLALIDRHAAPVSSGGRRESHTLETLAKRLGLPDTEHVQALVESGALESLNPVNRREPDGAQVYDNATLNEVKRAILAAIVERVVEDCKTDDPEAIRLAASHALDNYKRAVATGGEAVKEFAYRREPDRESAARRAVGTAALTGAAYGGLSYLRGRRSGAPGLLAAAKAGHAANVGNLKNVSASVRDALKRRLAGGKGAVGFKSRTPANARKLLLRFSRELKRNGLL